MQYTFHQLLSEQLNDLFSGEEQIAEALPHIIAVTSSGELRDAFDIYLKEIRQHIVNLDKIFHDLKISPSGSRCPAMDGILDAAENVLKRGGNSSVKDASLIAIVQRLQHYKIAVYGTARTFCRHLNHGKAMDLLQRALNEEGETDRQLTRLAEGGVFTTGINEEACRTKTSV